jgi:hypothetical protein
LYRILQHENYGLASVWHFEEIYPGPDSINACGCGTAMYANRLSTRASMLPENRGQSVLGWRNFSIFIELVLRLESIRMLTTEAVLGGDHRRLGQGLAQRASRRAG